MKQQNGVELRHDLDDYSFEQDFQSDLESDIGEDEENDNDLSSAAGVNDLASAAGLRSKTAESKQRKEVRRIRGGPAPKELTPTKKEVVDIMGGGLVIEGEKNVDEFGIKLEVRKNVIMMPRKRHEPSSANNSEDEDGNLEEIVVGLEDVSSTKVKHSTKGKLSDESKKCWCGKARA
ncbi:hypothetical protein U1Q18_050685 [Sarracenia purpurea var. burkii]